VCFPSEAACTNNLICSPILSICDCRSVGGGDEAWLGPATGETLSVPEEEAFETRSSLACAPFSGGCASWSVSLLRGMLKTG
jgi:hypothetical protein